MVVAVLPIAVVLALAAGNAPEVAPETIAAFAEAESGRSPLAIHDNTTRRSHAPDSVGQASSLARQLLARGHSLDLGLLQINDANLRVTGLTVETAFEPASSIRAGAQIMVAAYRQCEPGRSRQDALRCMASIYNTGREQAGLLNGYVARVWRVAERLVPAIQSADIAPPPAPVAVPPQGDLTNPEPPTWDIWAHAEWEASHSASSPPAAAEPPAVATDTPSTVTLHRFNPENTK